MQNMECKIKSTAKGKKLHLTIDLGVVLGPSKRGKMYTVGSSDGFVSLIGLPGGEDLGTDINLYRLNFYVGRYPKPEEAETFETHKAEASAGAAE